MSRVITPRVPAENGRGLWDVVRVGSVGDAHVGMLSVLDTEDGEVAERLDVALSARQLRAVAARMVAVADYLDAEKIA